MSCFLVTLCSFKGLYNQYFEPVSERKNKAVDQKPHPLVRQHEDSCKSPICKNGAFTNRTEPAPRLATAIACLNKLTLSSPLCNRAAPGALTPPPVREPRLLSGWFMR